MTDADYAVIAHGATVGALELALDEAIAAVERADLLAADRAVERACRLVPR